VNASESAEDSGRYGSWLVNTVPMRLSRNVSVEAKGDCGEMRNG